MAKRNILMKKKNGTSWDELYPITTVDNIINLQTTQDITYFVSANGNDNNTGLTSTKAFKTIQKAINMIPPIVNNNILINIAEGTYNEVLKICNFYGNGLIRIKGVRGKTIIKSIECSHCRCFIKLQDFDLNAYNATVNNHAMFLEEIHASFSFSAMSSFLDVLSLTMNHVNFIGDKEKSYTFGLYAEAAIVRLFECDLSNHKIAIEAFTEANVHAALCDGKGNGICFSAEKGGKIINASNMTGDVLKEEKAGGVVI